MIVRAADGFAHDLLRFTVCLVPLSPPVPREPGGSLENDARLVVESSSAW